MAKEKKPEQFSRTEAQARVMRMAVDLDAETDFIMLANENNP